MIRLTIIGLGHIGAVTLACLAQAGFELTGVEHNAARLDLLRQPQGRLVEPGLADLLAEGIAAGRIHLSANLAEALQGSAGCIICIGTPGGADGSLDMQPLADLCARIAHHFDEGAHYPVLIRSTLMPGTTRRLAGQAGTRLALAHTPDFLREGSAIADYHRPPYSLIGTDEAVAQALAQRLVAHIDAPVICTSPDAAELTKLTANAWHATKVSFANEIGRIASEAGIDAQEVMSLITQDTQLNVSPAYMRPGFAYGGACLPKDVQALASMAQGRAGSLPLMQAVSASNQAHIDAFVARILALGPIRLGLLGLAFKPGTDDLRQSPGLALGRHLLAAGADLRVYDPLIQPAAADLPDLAPYFADEDALLRHAQALIISYDHPQFEALIRQCAPDVVLLRLSHGLGELPR